jgi:hypothetical protein
VVGPIRLHAGSYHRSDKTSRAAPCFWAVAYALKLKAERHPAFEKSVDTELRRNKWIGLPARVPPFYWPTRVLACRPTSHLRSCSVALVRPAHHVFHVGAALSRNTFKEDILWSL